MLGFLPYHFQQVYPFDDKVSIQTINLTNQQQIYTADFSLNCSNPKILIGNTFLDFPNSQIGFSINYEILNKQIKFSTTNSQNNQISFQFAEICIDTFYVQVVEIKQTISFNNGIYQYTFEYQNAKSNMVVYAYLIGYNYEKCSQTQSITIQKCTANSGNILFEFFSTNQDTINYLKINFVAYEKDGQNTPYYYINQIDENKSKQTSQISFALNQSGYGEELSDEYSDYTNNNIKFIMIGLTGYILDQQSSRINLNLSLNQKNLQKNIQLIYTKQDYSKVYGCTSQVLIFQMKVCGGSQINYKDTCINQCPPGLFQIQDPQRLIPTCQLCDISCKTCDQSTQCLTCKDDYPYYLNDQKLCKKDYPAKYICIEKNQQTAKYSCDICSNCIENCKSVQSCCNYQNSDSYIQFENSTCQCKDNLSMSIDQANQQCSCKDQIKMKINDDKNSCICQDSQTMQLNLDKSSCDCIDSTTMKFFLNKCICQDEINMMSQGSKCDCSTSMFFNTTSNKCECKDINFMQYILSTKSCECPQNSKLIQDKCVCMDNQYYMDQRLKKCVQNPNIANCEIPNQQLPQCLKCQKGYRMVNGICKFCGNGKFFDDVTNDCTLSCIQYCYLCSNKQDCKQYEEQFPCHFSCQICAIPNSATACSLCSSPTRSYNQIDSTCNCIYGYQETGLTDCLAIQQSFSDSFLTLKTVLYNVSFYVQLLLAITPYFPYVQYSFILQQQIGLISEILPSDDSDMRIELLNQYKDYNFKFLAFVFTIASRLLSMQVIFSLIQIFLLSNQLESSVKALTTASVDSLIIIFFIISQIYQCKVVFKNIETQKQSSQISIDIKQILNQSQSGNISPSNILLIRDINTNCGSLNQDSKDTQIETGKRYKNPSSLDIVTIAIILIFQSIAIINALFVIYFKIKAIIIRLIHSKGTDKSKERQDTFYKGSFPQQIDIKLLFAQIYTNIGDQNFTIQKACIGFGINNSSFTLNQKIINCPYDKNLLVSPYLLDYPDYFNLTKQVNDNNSVSFSFQNKYQICFFIAEICLQNVYSRSYQLKNPIFNNNINQTFDKPSNFQKNMKAIGFITGYIPNENFQQYNQSLFLNSIKNNFSDQGFLIEFSIQSSIQISEININYIYFPDDQYSSDSSYFSILNSNDSQLIVNISSFTEHYSSNLQKTSTTLYNINNFQQTNLQDTTIFGINGFNFCSIRECYYFRAQLTFDYKANNYYYSTWDTSKIFSITSQFTRFQMLNCQQTNKTINFNEKCVNQCPDTFFLFRDPIRQILTCSKCSDNCQNCQNNTNQCITCNQNLTYLYNQNCSQNQPNNTYCKQVQGYYSCSECQPNCKNYCDKNGQCVDCINIQYYYNNQCVNGIPPPNTYYQNGKYYDCHQTCKTCNNDGPNFCISCWSDMILQNNSCVCSDQGQYFDNILLKCLLNLSYRNCEKLSQSTNNCEQCNQGFLNYSGTCIYCGNGKFVVSNNQCNGQCADNCIYCSDSTSCHNNNQDMLCYLTCSTCSKPLSQNSCLGCISATRQLNNNTNQCDCISGYEESGKVDCDKIKDPENYNKIDYSSPTILDIQIQQSRKQIPQLNNKNEINMNCFPKEFDRSTISQILEQSGKFSKHFQVNKIEFEQII
ncbi:hypothetical protein ABPG72_014753 [Tetrahymena utriculariae]